MAQNQRPLGYGALVEMSSADGIFELGDPAEFHLWSVQRVMADLRANDGSGVAQKPKVLRLPEGAGGDKPRGEENVTRRGRED